MLSNLHSNILAHPNGVYFILVSLLLFSDLFVTVLCFSQSSLLLLLYLKYHFRCCIANKTCCMHFTISIIKCIIDRNVCEKRTENLNAIVECLLLYSQLSNCSFELRGKMVKNSNLIWFWWCSTVNINSLKESLIERKSPKKKQQQQAQQ